MKFFTAGLFLLALSQSFNAAAAAKVNYLNVDGDSVHFSTAEAKSAVSPSCVVADTDDRFAVSLRTEAGRAMYSLLITAMSSDVPVTVTSAADCGDVFGLERAQSVSIAPPQTGQCNAFLTRKSEPKTVTFNALSENNVWYTVVDVQSELLAYEINFVAGQFSKGGKQLRVTVDGEVLPVMSKNYSTSTVYMRYASEVNGIPAIHAKKSLKVEILRSDVSDGNRVTTTVGYALVDSGCS
ncbi:hypothetical protein [Thalassomonas sp. RHCl1]|uniref:hypothetical protein n=1 Tax=Thalassomonas sp. RHCl1 TaxID=2995320 RepID=UPI00248B00CC|nr:hypothetical protein [Thalassomonas sp. RHCl1]